MAGGAAAGVGGAEADEKTAHDDRNEPAKGEQGGPTEEFAGHEAGEVGEAELVEGGLRGWRESDLPGTEQVDADPTADGRTEGEQEIPDAGGFPVIAEKGRAPRQEGGAQVAEVAGQAELFAAEELEQGNEEADERAGHVPGPGVGEGGGEHANG